MALVLPNLVSNFINEYLLEDLIKIIKKYTGVYEILFTDNRDYMDYNFEIYIYYKNFLEKYYQPKVL